MNMSELTQIVSEYWEEKLGASVVFGLVLFFVCFFSPPPIRKSQIHKRKKACQSSTFKRVSYTLLNKSVRPFSTSQLLKAERTLTEGVKMVARKQMK